MKTIFVEENMYTFLNFANMGKEVKKSLTKEEKYDLTIQLH